MVFIVIPFIPDGPVTKAIKKRLKEQRLDYKLGYLGELMDENFTHAKKHNHLLFQSEHLKLLKDVDENPQVVDIAFSVLEDQLQAQNLQLPLINEGRVPYYPNYKAILLFAVLNAIFQTIAISAVVVFLQHLVGLMTVLIVIISVIGAIAFIYTLYTCVTYVKISNG